MAACCVGARVGPAKTAAVSERMLDLPDAPTFLIEHRIIDHAADGEFGILLDRIILEIFVSAVAVNQIAPVRIALRECRGRARAPWWRDSMSRGL